MKAATHQPKESRKLKYEAIISECVLNFLNTLTLIYSFIDNLHDNNMTKSLLFMIRHFG